MCVLTVTSIVVEAATSSIGEMAPGTTFKHVISDEFADPKQ